MCDRCKYKKPCFFDYYKIRNKKENEDGMYSCPCRDCGKEYNMIIQRSSIKRSICYVILICIIHTFIMWFIKYKVMPLIASPNSLPMLVYWFGIYLILMILLVVIVNYVNMYIEWKYCKIQ